MRIAITGTPGTGKSTLARKIQSVLVHKGLDYQLISITDLLLTNPEIISEQDESRGVPIVDLDALDELLQDKQNVLIDGHFSHELSVDAVICCTCERGALQNRLKARNYSTAKIAENIQAEIFDTCYIESIEQDKKTLKVDCTSEKSYDVEMILSELGL